MKNNELIDMILKNEILRKQCDECLGIWFKFWWAHGNKGYFRLSPLAPDSCSVCRPLDEELESNAVYTVERWMYT